MQELPLGAVTADAPTSETYAELLLFAAIAEGAVKLTTIGAEFDWPAVSGPVLVTVKLVIAAAWAESALKTGKEAAVPMAIAEANSSDEARVWN